jgi:hypothetical protein
MEQQETDIYILGRFNRQGVFIEYIRKGKNNAISGYSSLSSAKRGRSQCKPYIKGKIKIIKMSPQEVLDC